MELKFKNARENLFDGASTVSGLDPGEAFYASYDLYSDEFCKQLTSLGCVTDEDYSLIFQCALQDY